MNINGPPMEIHFREKAQRARELALDASHQLTIERLESFAHEYETGRVGDRA